MDADTWPDAFSLSAIAVDPSKGRDTGDFGAIVWIGLARGLFWVDALVDRWPVPVLCRNIVDHFRHLGADRVGIESNAFQDLLGPEVERIAAESDSPPLPISLINNSTNKVLRISRLGPYLERHRFRFRRTDGNRRLVAQLKAFPLGSHDDGPDALEMGVRLIQWLARPPQE